MLKCPVYLDSSTLSDLRTLFTTGIDESDCIVLIATKGILTRPWCLLESALLPPDPNPNRAWPLHTRCIR